MKSRMNPLQLEQFKELTEEVMKFINDNPEIFDPYSTIEISQNTVVVKQKTSIDINNNYLKD